MTELTVTSHETIDAVDENQWDTLVRQSDLGSVFHRHGWLRAVERGLDRRPEHFVVRKGSNPVALLPNFRAPVDLPDPSALLERFDSPTLVDRLPTGALGAVSTVAGAPADASADALDSLPVERLCSTAPGFGGPVVLTDEAECLDMLFDALDDAISEYTLCHVVKAKEPAFMRYGKFLAGRGYAPTLLDCRFVLDVDRPFEEVLDGMDKERRKAVRDAREREYEVTERPLAETLDETYDRYLRDMERAGGDPYPRSFFAALAADFPERTRVFSAEVDGVAAGQYVYLLDDEQSAVHYFFSAIGDESNYEYNPTELLHSHVAEWAREHGYDAYDFGSTGSTFRDGTFKYKEKYGARVVPTLRWERGGSPVLWNAYRVARRGYQRYAYPDT
ncbi:GNAT family N-acetyltransferase [Halosimplex aquaticum]|uniref:GNAT family N-acetyltransferase n=1 Tax=Halosimplex aquaticum TaxID=3026162 RepID=A0ABD5Y0X9_9EURY|nr:GNAT family N-acetyltransferase [Halosimplex aquaticum]